MPQLQGEDRFPTPIVEESIKRFSANIYEIEFAVILRGADCVGITSAKVFCLDSLGERMGLYDCTELLGSNYCLEQLLFNFTRRGCSAEKLLGIICEALEGVDEEVKGYYELPPQSLHFGAEDLGIVRPCQLKDLQDATVLLSEFSFPPSSRLDDSWAILYARKNTRSRTPTPFVQSVLGCEAFPLSIGYILPGVKGNNPAIIFDVTTRAEENSADLARSLAATISSKEGYLVDRADFNETKGLDLSKLTLSEITSDSPETLPPHFLLDKAAGWILGINNVSTLGVAINAHFLPLLLAGFVPQSKLAANEKLLFVAFMHPEGGAVFFEINLLGEMRRAEIAANRLPEECAATITDFVQSREHHAPTNPALLCWETRHCVGGHLTDSSYYSVVQQVCLSLCQDPKDFRIVLKQFVETSKDVSSLLIRPTAKTGRNYWVSLSIESGQIKQMVVDREETFMFFPVKSVIDFPELVPVGEILRIFELLNAYDADLRKALHQSGQFDMVRRRRGRILPVSQLERLE